MSQLEAGVLKLDREKIDLVDLSGDLDTHLAPLVSTHSLQIDFPRDLPPVLIDMHRVVQVISNLVSNAAKFSEAGKGITVGAARLDGDVVVRVRDEGRGIPFDWLDRVFEPFYRVEGPSSSVSSGSGLGLSICRRLVEAHGGTMWAESELDRGTTMYFSLPVADDRAGS